MGHEMKFYVRLVFVFIHKVIINPMNMMIVRGNDSSCRNTQIFIETSSQLIKKDYNYLKILEPANWSG